MLALSATGTFIPPDILCGSVIFAMACPLIACARTIMFLLLGLSRCVECNTAQTLMKKIGTVQVLNTVTNAAETKYPRFTKKKVSRIVMLLPVLVISGRALLCSQVHSQ
jgi:hypothetical protein